MPLHSTITPDSINTVIVSTAALVSSVVALIRQVKIKRHAQNNTEALATTARELAAIRRQLRLILTAAAALTAGARAEFIKAYNDAAALEELMGDIDKPPPAPPATKKVPAQ